MERKQKKIKNKEYIKFLDGIIKVSKGLHTMIEENRPTIRGNIEDIIKNNIKSPQEIEEVFDILISYAFAGIELKQEFTRLNRYYTTINKEAAVWYRKEYQRILRKK